MDPNCMKFNDLVVPWYLKLAGWVLLAGVVIAAALGWEHRIAARADAAGYERADSVWRLREAVIARDVERQRAADQKDAEAKQAALQAKIDEQAAQRAKEKADHEKDIAQHIAFALSGRERLRIAVDAGAGGALPGEAAGAGPGAGTAPGGEARADVLPGTAAAVFRIAGDYGQLVRDYNAVVAQYADIRAECNRQ